MILQISDDENIKVKIANNFFKKLIGFMGKKDFDYGIIFPKTNSIHTFFIPSFAVTQFLNFNQSLLV